MKKYVVEFLKRGMAFGGFGPIVVGVICLIFSLVSDTKFTGIEVFSGIISTYLLAFIHAGASVFNQIEEWSISKSLAFHLSSLYFAYLGCYLINSWIPFDWIVVLIFTIIFLVTYFVIWIVVYFITKDIAKKLNKKIS